MMNARRQAEAYVPLLPAGHDPPFLIVCDVGRCLEVYADFRRDGKVYHRFPDRQGFRIGLDGLTLTGLYHVRARIRDGARPADLDAPARAIHERGLVLILDELHRGLDRAAAYGWSGELADAEVLGRLVALNAERAAEERRGMVRWLRPARQAPAWGFAEAGPELHFAPGAAAASAPNAPFPPDDVEQTAMVYAALARATRALDADAIASRYRGGKRTVPKVAAVLAALHRLGVVGTADGRSFSLLRAG